MAYEAYNMIFHKIVPVTWGLCGCSAAPADKEIKIKCNLKKGQPGIPCQIALPITKLLFKVSLGLWKTYTALANICKVPTTPLV